MLYSWAITAPANTGENDPVRERLKLTHGVISKVSVVFPPGCAGLVHLQVFHGAAQLWPSNMGEDLAGDTFPIEWGEYIELFDHPYSLTTRLWSDDDTYPHTVHIRVALTPQKAVTPFALADAVSRLFKGLIPRRILPGGPPSGSRIT